MVTRKEKPVVSKWRQMQLPSTTVRLLSSKGAWNQGQAGGNLRCKQTVWESLVSAVGRAGSYQIVFREILEELQLEVCYLAKYLHEASTFYA